MAIKYETLFLFYVKFAIHFHVMLQVKDLVFGYKNNPVLNQLSFSVIEGEHISIIGESGSGKSTLLKLLHGELDANQGQIFWKGQEILGPKYKLVVDYDFLKYVAQEFDLMSFMTVEENIGKHLSNFYRDEKEERVKELINVVELQPFAKSKVKTLSGGQKQRVALARALAKEPEILLKDTRISILLHIVARTSLRNVYHFAVVQP